VKKLVLAISAMDTDEVLERWVFDVQMDGAALAEGFDKERECECFIAKFLGKSEASRKQRSKRKSPLS